MYPFQSIFSKLKFKNSFQRKLYYGIRLFLCTELVKCW
ncbi:hypothetical protein LRU_02228 [Ligilactobacillus ruminis SPM0211]|uniref:Uncharacterized protein n=1 Tax=Ligilactobacillus ruminis SPM0211 TaxID=1040964 RepID=F7R3G4_9LACO|nr:hypothetical protein LRU_02228 [Ligilactobacillus ruminis SPM0211]